MGHIELINRLKEKDQKALDLIIRNYNHYVAAVIYSVLKDCVPEIDIQALVNQVFFLLWENASKIDCVTYDDFKPYLGAIARNLALSERRKMYESQPINDAVLGEVDESIDRILLENIIYKALTKLKKEEQMIILQHYFQGIPIKEIAGMTNQPEATVKTKIRRSRIKLKKILESEGIFSEDDLQ